MTKKRRKTRLVKIGNVKIGAGNPVSIQSMAKTRTQDVRKTIDEIKRLQDAGCQIARVAVKEREDASALGEIKKGIRIPLVADIHFDHRLALASIDQRVDAVRLNPGNVYKEAQVKEVAQKAKKAKIPIRIGVNSGSLRMKRRGLSEDALMVKSASDYIKHFEESGFYDIIISLKSADVSSTISAYRKMAAACDYPLHLGVTATGIQEDGIIKSAIGIGSLLSEGIGDTIRVSLTAEAVFEVEVAKSILQSLGLGCFGPEVISCPTCGRCQVDIEGIVKDLKYRLQTSDFRLQTKKPVKIAVMGCEVNGPGEAREAHIGVAAGKKSGILFRKGKIVKRVRERNFAKEILKNI
ncbi:flavodoxin-dependent (E)-4-hydroxy-3-methylbut-2-enyl-diphosphate synthase [Omnitrophica bacterium]|nr:flavodoxin-dependent (E)-4-hydroxy-3-methylbut-2-enyl-diphosphate synthase [Candidatus Omnitrophota bacterium]